MKVGIVGFLGSNCNHKRDAFGIMIPVEQVAEVVLGNQGSLAIFRFILADV